MMDRQNVLDHVTGCLVGAVIGDALGHPANGMTPWEVIRKFNFIDGFYSINGIFGKYTEQSKKMLNFAHCIVPVQGESSADWMKRLGEFNKNNQLPFASKAIPIGLAMALHDMDNGQVADLLRASALYPETDKSEGLAMLLVARMVKECVLNHDKIGRPFDLYDSSESVLNKMYVLSAHAEEALVKAAPLRDSFAERLTLVRSRLMKNDTFSSMVGMNGAGNDHFESVPLALFAFMNEPDEVATLYKVASLGNAASQNAALVGSFVGGYLGITYLHEMKDQVENSIKIHGLAAGLVEAFLPTPKGEFEETTEEGEV